MKQVISLGHTHINKSTPTDSYTDEKGVFHIQQYNMFITSPSNKAIIILNYGHAVVLSSVNSGYIIYTDPQNGNATGIAHSGNVMGIYAIYGNN